MQVRKKDYSILSYLADPGQIQQLWQGEESQQTESEKLNEEEESEPWT